MSLKFLQLDAKAQRGSKPRCHILTDGNRSEVAQRLTDLAQGFATIAPQDTWLPDGFQNTTEAELHKNQGLIHSEQSKQILQWWLAKSHANAKTPNFDIASTCTVHVNGLDRRGILLVEAKAHTNELFKESVGKKLAAEASKDSIANHEQIGRCIENSKSILEQAIHEPWGISRDRCYQISNRFAIATKLAELDIPVVLVYLGFTNADEMEEGDSLALRDIEHWKKVVLAHSHGIVPESVWGTPISIGSQWIIPLISTTQINLP